MTTIHLLDAHAGVHRVKRPTLRRRIADAALSAWEWLRTTECLLPPAPMTGIALVPPVPFGVTARPAEDNPPLYDEVAEWAETARLAGSHPYPPLPMDLPLLTGDGHVHIDETGHVTVRRGAPVVHPTLYDLPKYRPYAPQNRALALGPDGCEET